MRRRDDKIARAAHIKERTHGTSNEISFSVLDAAKYKETTQRFSLRDLLAARRDANAQSVRRQLVRTLTKPVLAGGEAESGLNRSKLSRQPNARRLSTHQVIAKKLRLRRRLLLSACPSKRR